MSCQGQRLRTPKEQEMARRMIESGRYEADQWECEKELQKIHESECDFRGDVDGHV